MCDTIALICVNSVWIFVKKSVKIVNMDLFTVCNVQLEDIIILMLIHFFVVPFIFFGTLCANEFSYCSVLSSFIHIITLQRPNTLTDTPNPIPPPIHIPYSKYHTKHVPLVGFSLHTYTQIYIIPTCQIHSRLWTCSPTPSTITYQNVAHAFCSFRMQLSFYSAKLCTQLDSHAASISACFHPPCTPDFSPTSSNLEPNCYVRICMLWAVQEMRGRSRRCRNWTRTFIPCRIVGGLSAFPRPKFPRTYTDTHTHRIPSHQQQQTFVCFRSHGRNNNGPTLRPLLRIENINHHHVEISILNIRPDDRYNKPVDIHLCSYCKLIRRQSMC